MNASEAMKVSDLPADLVEGLVNGLKAYWELEDYDVLGKPSADARALLSEVVILLSQNDGPNRRALESEIKELKSWRKRVKEYIEGRLFLIDSLEKDVSSLEKEIRRYRYLQKDADLQLALMREEYESKISKLSKDLEKAKKAAIAPRTKSQNYRVKWPDTASVNAPETAPTRRKRRPILKRLGALLSPRRKPMPAELL